MLDTSRVDGLVNKSWLKMPIAVAGVGAVGSILAEQLVLLGFEDVTVFDPDTIESLNVTNQLYTNLQVGLPKAETCAKTINNRYFKDDDIQPVKYENKEFRVKDNYFMVFNCVDSVEGRTDVLHRCMEANILYYAETFLGVYNYDAVIGKLDAQLANELIDKHESLNDAPESEVVSPCGGKISCGFQVLQLVGRTVEAFVKMSSDMECKKTMIIKGYQDFCVTNEGVRDAE